MYIVILFGFSLCNLERQRIKFCARSSGQFLCDVNIDVNENHLHFPSLQNIIFFTTLYNI